LFCWFADERTKALLDMTYRIEQAIGTGGFGTVYGGFRRCDNMPVAIKHIAKSRVTAMAEVCAGIRHEFIHDDMSKYLNFVSCDIYRAVL